MLTIPKLITPFQMDLGISITLSRHLRTTRRQKCLRLDFHDTPPSKRRETRPLISYNFRYLSKPIRGAPMNREDAWNILCEYTKTEPLRKHALAVEAAMRAYARRYD